MIDETGCMPNPLVRRSLALRGHTPVIYAPATREKVSVMAALSLSARLHLPQLYFRSYPNANVNAERSADFLKSLLRRIPGQLIVVWDNATFHRGAAVRELLTRTRRLTIEPLPPYAPELNPVEYLWSYLKTNNLANLTLTDAEDLDAVIQHNLQEISMKGPLLDSFYCASPLEDITTAILF